MSRIAAAGTKIMNTEITAIKSISYITDQIILKTASKPYIIQILKNEQSPTFCNQLLSIFFPISQ